MFVKREKNQLGLDGNRGREREQYTSVAVTILMSRGTESLPEVRGNIIFSNTSFHLTLTFHLLGVVLDALSVNFASRGWSNACSSSGDRGLGTYIS
jgi:hypothetical protein